MLRQRRQRGHSTASQHLLSTVNLLSSPQPATSLLQQNRRVSGAARCANATGVDIESIASDVALVQQPHHLQALHGSKSHHTYLSTSFPHSYGTAQCRHAIRLRRASDHRPNVVAKRRRVRTTATLTTTARPDEAKRANVPASAMSARARVAGCARTGVTSVCQAVQAAQRLA